MMGDLADGYRSIAILPEKAGETGKLDIVGSRKKSAVAGWPAGTGQQSVTGGPAGGGLYEMSMKGAAQGGQLVDVR
jgi:hypothetical protein